MTSESWLSQLVLLTVTWSYTVYATRGQQTIDEANTLECHVRNHNHEISRPYVTALGEVLHCNGTISVSACWGRCHSQDVGDYKVPYHISDHPVCTYGGKGMRTVRLQNCHPDHPDPYSVVFDAESCVCQACNPSHTNCEHTSG